ncbi:MAG: hypothetical protein ACI9A1_001377 [Lentimonas sp.]|jgi:hypothetical protein
MGRASINLNSAVGFGSVLETTTEVCQRWRSNLRGRQYGEELLTIRSIACLVEVLVNTRLLPFIRMDLRDSSFQIIFLG